MKTFVVAGDPIDHSLSPVMHNAAFKALGLKDHVYNPLKLNANSLHILIGQMRKGKISGANLTHPLKEDVIPLVDTLTEDARSCGSVNTLILESGKIVGDTTDGEGCVKALLQNGVDIKNKNFLIIGAGGAARSIIFSLIKRNPNKIIIVNRTLERAQDIISSLKEHKKIEAFKMESLSSKAIEADIIINCTTIGKSSNEMPPMDIKALRGGQVVMDIVYDPLETKFLKTASAVGCKTIDGLEMLVQQGALSLERWIGIKPPVEIMREAILEKIKGD